MSVEPVATDGTPAAKAGPLGRRVTEAVFWTALLHGARIVLQLAFVAVLARLLTPQDYGIVAAGMIVVSFSMLVTGFGIDITLVQRSVLTSRHIRTGFTLIMIVCLGLFAVTQAAAPLVQDFFRFDGLESVFRVLTLMFVLQGLGMVAQSLLLRDLRARRVMSVELASQAVSTGLIGIPLAWSGFGPWALVWASVSEAALRSLLLIISKPYPMLPLLDGSAMRDLLRTSAGFSLAKILNFGARQGDNIIVGRFMGSVDLGLYGRAYQLIVLPARAYDVVAERVVFPAMAQVQNEPERLRKAYFRAIAITALIGLPLTTSLIVIAPELILTLLGPAWTGAIAPFLVLCFSMYFRLGYKVHASLLRAKGASFQLASTQGLYAALVIAACLVAYPFGLQAVAGGVSLAIAINLVVLAVMASKLIGLRFGDQVRAHLPGGALALIVGLSGWMAAEALRGWEAQSASVLISTTLVMALTGGIAVTLGPSWFLGPHGQPVFQNVKSILLGMRLFSGRA